MVVGLLGVSTKESITHDLRIRTDLTPYNQLDSFQTLESNQSKDYQLPYIGLYWSMTPMDEFEMGLVGKRYFDDKDNEFQFAVDDYTVNLFLKYYPTMEDGWIKNIFGL